MAGRRPTKAVERVETSILSSFYVRLLIVGVIVLGGAFFIGTSDSGQINVASTIQSSNEAAVEAGGDPADNVPTAPSAFQSMPNGGLVPADPNAQPAPAPEPEPVPEDVSSTTPEGGSEEGEESSPDGAEAVPAN